MGFMDKAKAAAQDATEKGKKLAEQAQAKLEEQQKNFNKGQAHESGPGAAATEYDSHGRPIANEPTVAETVRASEPAAEVAPEDTGPPQGDPLAEESPAPKAPAPPPGDGSGLTSGDPLAR
jgi:hypothetical protein